VGPILEIVFIGKLDPAGDKTSRIVQITKDISK